MQVPVLWFLYDNFVSFPLFHGSQKHVLPRYFIFPINIYIFHIIKPYHLPNFYRRQWSLQKWKLLLQCILYAAKIIIVLTAWLIFFSWRIQKPCYFLQRHVFYCVLPFIESIYTLQINKQKTLHLNFLHK